jgi:anti-anti-sigma factor
VIFEVTTLPSGALSLSGELDMGTVGELDAALKPLCAAWGPITIQVSGLTFMDSTGIHAFVRAAMELKHRGCIILHGVDGQARLRKVMELTRVEDVRNIHVIECDVL